MAVMTPPKQHQFIDSLIGEAPIPARGILSQTLSDEDGGTPRRLLVRGW